MTVTQNLTHEIILALFYNPNKFSNISHIYTHLFVPENLSKSHKIGGGILLGVRLIRGGIYRGAIARVRMIGGGIILGVAMVGCVSRGAIDGVRLIGWHHPQICLTSSFLRGKIGAIVYKMYPNKSL